ncbi:N-acetyltransferase [Thalassotalea insulae]|uniref:N-acetyltransferase n=1 Tax=Thalassotalea insulae TaxID=2056778 RepID=A0ABQ6GLU8_9GAMM|nr:GNAT family protein [Thalassotalea insulae]GLX76983.1 N-acetyltransferase [Thalassotalea insulae]
MQFPELATSRLNLTKITESDASSIFTLFSDPSVVEYYDLEVFTDIAQASRLIAFFNGRYNEALGIRWGIRVKGSDTLIGTCGFNRWNAQMKNAVIGYDLMSDFWGQGYITEAVNSIVAAAFNGKLPCGELNRIQADTVPGNKGSEFVLGKIGFQEEGLRRESGYWKNQFHDLKCFALLKSDYQAINC